MLMVKLTRGLLLPVRAAWWCNRISTRRIWNRANQPGFVFWRRTSAVGPQTSGLRPQTNLCRASLDWTAEGGCPHVVHGYYRLV